MNKFNFDTNKYELTQFELDALLAEHLAVNSGEAVAYRYRYWEGAVWNLSLQPTLEVDSVWLSENYPNFSIEPLYTANPLNKELLDAVKSMGDALRVIEKDIIEITDSETNQRILAGMTTLEMINVAREALTSLSPNVIKLIGE